MPEYNFWNILRVIFHSTGTYKRHLRHSCQFTPAEKKTLRTSHRSLTWKKWRSHLCRIYSTMWLKGKCKYVYEGLFGKNMRLASLTRQNCDICLHVMVPLNLTKVPLCKLCGTHVWLVPLVEGLTMWHCLMCHIGMSDWSGRRWDWRCQSSMLWGLVIRSREIHGWKSSLSIFQKHIRLYINISLLNRSQSSNGSE